jgi:hypothetical protein
MFDIVYNCKNIDRALEKCKTRYLWVLDQHTDYSNFDLTWEPAPWEAHQAHIWPSQHQEHGGTMLIPKQGATENNYNHSPVTRINGAHRLHIKHTVSSRDEGDINTRYISNYMDTMRRALRKTDWEYCWVTSDICTYTDFDFTWHPSEWQQDMLHVFASNEQKFGDTFYVHVPSFLEKTENLEVLEWFETLHFVEDIRVKRYLFDSVQYTSDSLVDAVWDHNFEQPVTLFYRGNKMIQPPTISLWQERTKTVVPLSKGGECTLVPRETKNYLKTQIYDYPWIDKSFPLLEQTQQMDIVYISYDEPEAEKNYEKIKTKFPRTKRVHGVHGMENALREGARVSDTPWYYAVFAKTEIADEFEFDYAPNYMMQPKHYIFNCRNRVNGLEYGHMGIILYNCNMVLDALPYEELGLDYTVSFPVEVVPELSCYGNFDTSAYHTWRTSFREAGKLAFFENKNPSMENRYRLDIWQTRAEGEFAEWALNGARDGVEFFEESGGDLAYMKQSFDWNWLRERFIEKYGDLA